LKITAANSTYYNLGTRQEQKVLEQKLGLLNHS